MSFSPAQKFNEIAKETHDAYPERLKRLVLFFVPTFDTPVYVSPEMVSQLTRDTAILKKAVATLAQEMDVRNYAGEACKNYPLDGLAVDLISIDEENNTGAFPERFTQEMQFVLTLDHELGHLILRNGSSTTPGVSRHMAESAASAYGILQHVRRYGLNTDHAAGYAASKAADIILCADMDHYVADAVEEAFRQAEQQDISSLSLAETAALAEKIADNRQLDKATLEKIRDAFRSVREIHEVYGGNAALYTNMICTEVFSIMQEKKNDADIFMAGKRFLNMAGNKAFMVEAAKENSFWRNALDFIDRHDPKAALAPRITSPGFRP